METTPHHLNPENEHIHYGYFPFIKGDVSHKEFFSMGRPFSDIGEWEKNGCALYEELTWIKDDTENRWILDEFQATFKRLHNFSLKLMSYFAIGLGKPKNYFDPWFKDECNTTLRPIHYLPRNGVQVEGHYLDPELFKLVTPEHADSGFLTLLSTFMYPGL